MQYEARGMLEDQVDDIIKFAITKVTGDYDDVPHNVMLLLTVEFAEGYLHGMYNLWCVMNDEGPADGNVNTIEEIVATRYERIKNTLKEIDDS